MQALESGGCTKWNSKLSVQQFEVFHHHTITKHGSQSTYGIFGVSDMKVSLFSKPWCWKV
jgi:hypothetical protein